MKRIHLYDGQSAMQYADRQRSARDLEMAVFI